MVGRRYGSFVNFFQLWNLKIHCSFVCSLLTANFCSGWHVRWEIWGSCRSGNQSTKVLALNWLCYEHLWGEAGVMGSSGVERANSEGSHHDTYACRHTHRHTHIHTQTNTTHRHTHIFCIVSRLESLGSGDLPEALPSRWWGVDQLSSSQFPLVPNQSLIRWLILLPLRNVIIYNVLFFKWSLLRSPGLKCIVFLPQVLKTWDNSLTHYIWFQQYLQKIIYVHFP